MRASTGIFVATLLALAALSTRVHAGGPQLLPGGTQAVARGGAVAARPENAMALIQNPAGLALLEDGQFLLNLDLPLQSECVDAYGYYGWNVGTAMENTEFGQQLTDPRTADKNTDYGLTPLPKVCNSAQSLAIPNMAWVGKIGDDLTLAGGFIAPTVVPGLQYGGSDGTVQVQNPDPDPKAKPLTRPTPTRYELIRQQVKFAFAPTFGVAYRFSPLLQVGVSTTVIMIRAVARAIANSQAGSAPYNDLLVDVDTHDYFVPTGVVSVNSKPIPELDFTAAFHWADSFRGSGNVRFITNYFQSGQTSGPIPTRNGPFKLSEVDVGFPWELTFGARYGALLSHHDEAKPGAKKKQSLGDPMDRELWDIEIDASYALNTAARASSIKADNITVVSRNAGGNGDTSIVDPTTGSDVAKRPRMNSTAVRIGGSVSVLPRELALEAGAFYETRGVDPAYVTIDNFALARIGFGVGGIFRTGDFDLMLAYSHIFQETVEVAPPESSDFSQRVGFTRSADGTMVGLGPIKHDPDAPSATAADAVAAARPSKTNPNLKTLPAAINAGKYTASFNVISAGMVYHF